MLNKITCLLVDDDEDDREIFQIALDDIGREFQCVVAADGIFALEKLSDRNFKPDYIFLDLNMPRMNGKECITEIKKIDRLAGVPVIIYSTSSTWKDMDDARKLGAAHYFTKPPSIRALSDALKEIFIGSESFSLNR